MGFFNSLKKALQGPPHVQGGDDEGAAAALHEEYGIVPEDGVDYRMAPGTGGVGGPAVPSLAGLDGSEAGEVAEDDESAPPDLDP
jgi:hypothetical protein